MCEAKVGYVVRVVSCGTIDYYNGYYWDKEGAGVRQEREKAYVYSQDQLINHKFKYELNDPSRTIIIPVRRLI